MNNTGIELLLGIVPCNFMYNYVVDDDVVDITSLDKVTTVIPCFNFDGSSLGLVKKILSDINKTEVLFDGTEEYALLTLQVARPRVNTYPSFYAAVKDGFGCYEGGEQAIKSNPILRCLAMNLNEPSAFYATLKGGVVSDLILCSHLTQSPFKCIVGPVYTSEIINNEELATGYRVGMGITSSRTALTNALTT